MIDRQPIADDANPYWLVLTGRREEAIRHWEQRLATDPHDVRLWHELGVVHYWQAHADDTRGTINADAWEHAISYWVGVLASHAYWREWGECRAVACGVPPEDLPLLCHWYLTWFVRDGAREQERLERVIEGIESARRGVHGALDAALSRARETAEGASREIYANLMIRLALEWAVAARLERLAIAEDVANAATARPVSDSFQQWLSKGRWRSGGEIDRALLTAYVELGCQGTSRRTVPSCGPTMLVRLGLIEAAREWVVRGGPPRTPIQALEGLLEGVREDARQLHFYLDPVLGPLLAMRDAGEYERCKADVGQRLVGGRDARSRDLKKVMCLACHGHAEVALSRGEPDLAVSCLETAYQYCLTATMDTRPFASDAIGLTNRVGDAIGAADLPSAASLGLADRLLEVAPAACGSRLSAIRAKLSRDGGRQT